MKTNQPQPNLMAALHHDPDACLLVDAKGQVLAHNPAAAPDITLPVNHGALVQAALSQQRTVTDVEARDGDLIRLWSYQPVAGAEQVLARGRDATHSQQTLHEAVQANRLYRLITENTTDLISRHAPDSTFIYASPASFRLLGYWPEELRGKRLADLVNPADLSHLMGPVREKLRDEGYATMTLHLRHKDGRDIPFETASRAIRETYTGAIIEVVSVSRDMTERELREQERQRHQEEMAHTARLATLGELASGIAHEMNQPLATIVNYASASLRYLNQANTQPESLAKVADGLERITRHANHAAEVIRRLRAFLRKGQKRMTRVPLNEVVRESLRLCQWEARKHEVMLTDRLDEPSPDVWVDPILLGQVMINLLRNGIEANRDTHPGQESELRVQTGTDHQGQPYVSVEDQGPGLDAEARDHLFTPFYTRKADGLGLGLSMSKSIIEGFGASLEALDADCGGLRMTCTFPAERNERTPSHDGH
ncbi:MAG: PAS domain S-box protein [Marinobacter sp.]|nr:PAS domain S-box protein [Marinobacter sp.]